MNAKDQITEVSVSAGRKMQLEQYEPINEQATVTADVPDDLSEDEFDEFMEELSKVAREKAEQGITRRYEEHVRAEAFGDD